MNKEIKKHQRKDKKEALIEQFRENDKDIHKKHLWKAVKNHKSRFSPKYIQMRNRGGHAGAIKEKSRGYCRLPGKVSMDKRDGR